MGKRNAFKEILKKDFSWPKKGDKALVVAKAPADNATIGGEIFDRLVLMMRGYKQSADLLVAATESDVKSRDVLVYPIIFNYRHFLELSLKYQLFAHGEKVGVHANWKTHDLAVLWSEFIKIVERYGTSDPDEADPAVEEIIAEFAKIDVGSFSHRYPCDRSGDAIPVNQSQLDLGHLREVMECVENYFSGSDGYFSSCGG